MLHHLNYLLSCSLLFFLSFPSVAQFGEKQVVASQQESQSYVLVADFNQDGVSDVVAVEGESTNENTSLRYIIRYNDGDGNFDQGQLIKEEKKEPWLDLRATDIDGDGKTDLVIRQDEADKIGWLRNQGDSFAWEADMLKNFDSYGVIDYTFTKINDDQYLDLLFVTEEGLFWSENNYEEPFSPPTLLLSPEDENVTSLFANDFDEDGDDDIFLLGDFVSIFRKENNGSYTFQKLETDHWDEMRNPQFADMDGDGNKDLVISDGNSCGTSNLWYHKNLGNTFSKPTYIAGYNGKNFLDVDYIYSFYLEDIDDDGDIDMYISSQWADCGEYGGDEKLIWIQNINNWDQTEEYTILQHHNTTFSYFNSDDKIDFFPVPWWFGRSYARLEDKSFNSDFIWVENKPNQPENYNYKSIDRDIKYSVSDIIIDYSKEKDIKSIISSSRAKVMRHTEVNSKYASETIKYYEFDYEGSLRLNLADADGDNIEDIFVTHEQSAMVWFSWYKMSFDIYQEKSFLVYIDEPFPLDLLLADYDSNNSIDVLVSESRYDQWYSNDGDGNFNYKDNIPDFTSIINYDNDGIDDFIGKDAVYRSLGNGTVEQVLDIGGNQVHDLDGDGLDDILYIAERNQGSSYWHRNQGDGQFSDKQSLSLAPQGAYHFSDVDNDGDADFLYDSSGKLVWKENTDGIGNFGNDQLIESVATTVIRSADMDDDGDMDLVVGGNGFIYEYENLSINEADTPLFLQLSSIEGLQQDTVSIPIKVKSGFENITSLSFSLTWDTEAATYAGVKSTEELTLEMAGTENGQLGITWEKAGGQSKNDGSTLFSLLLVLTGEEQSSSEVSFTDEPVAPVVTNAEGKTVPFSTENGKVTIEESKAPTNISVDNSIIKENQPTGTLVGKFTTADPDNSDGFVYALVAGEGDADNGSFSINEQSLITKAVFDYEADSIYSIRVQTTDSRGKTFTKIFTIKVEDTDDTNNNPTAISLSSSTIDENNEVLASIGELSVEDPDEDDTHTFKLVSGEGDDDNEEFIIESNQLLAKKSFDFEDKDEYSIRVEATDNRGGSYSQPLTITINDVDESTNNPPTAISLSKAAVEENQPENTVVGTFTTTDADEEDSHTYALVAGEGSEGNEVFQIKDDQLQTQVSLDYEEQEEYAIRVQTNDGNGGSFTQTFTITVVNQLDDPNRPPTNITLDNNAIDENQPRATLVGNLLTEDPDNSIFTYSLVSGSGDTHNDLFTISGNELLSATSFDYENLSQLSVRIQSDDRKGGRFGKVFSILVNDVEDQANRLPTDILLSNQTVEENMPVGTPIGAFSTLDPDATDQHQYQLSAGNVDNDNNAFAIDGNQLLSAATFDFSAQSSYIIRVQTDDGKGGTYAKSFVISVKQASNVTPLGVANPLDDQQASANEPFSLTIPDDVFEGESLTLAVTQSDGSPLPDWLTFDAPTNTLSGTPPEGDVSVEIRVTATNGDGDSVNDDFVLSVEGVTAVGDDVAENLRIYPVPAQRVLHIESQQSTLRLHAYRLLDVQGKVLMEQPPGKKPMGRIRVDVSSLVEGIYFLELQTNKGLQQQRVLVQ